MDRAFADNQLTSVVLPNSVTSIGRDAFKDNQLTSITLPANVNIDYNAFEEKFFSYYNDRAKKKAGKYILNSGVWSLQGAVQSTEDFEVTQNADGKSLTISKYNGLLSEVTIPEKLYNIPVTVIGKGAFANMGLTDVVLPNTLTGIGGSAFSGNKLTKVVIPNSVTEIGDYAFSGNQLTSVVLGTRVSIIGRNAFAGNQLAAVDIPNSVTVIGVSAFAGNKLTGVVIPNSVTGIGYEAFAGNQLTSISLGNGLIFMDHSIFDTDKLTSVTIAKDVPTGVVQGGYRERQFGISTGSGFETSFINYYESQKRAPGTYVKNGPIWSKK